MPRDPSWAAPVVRAGRPLPWERTHGIDQGCAVPLPLPERDRLNGVPKTGGSEPRLSHGLRRRAVRRESASASGWRGRGLCRSASTEARGLYDAGVRPRGLVEARRQRREARIAAAVLLLLAVLLLAVFVLAWARSGSPADVMTVLLGR